LNIRSTVF